MILYIFGFFTRCYISRAIICYIECESGERFAVRSCVKGKLISINQNVVKNPSLIVDKSPGEAHLAIILTKIPDGLNDLKERLMPESEYVTRKDIKTFNQGAETV